MPRPRPRARTAPGQLLLGLIDDEHGLRDILMLHLRQEREHAHFVPEMGVSHGTARIDLASIDDSLDGFEIKSDRDDLRRLPTQTEAYGRVFDRLTIVTTERHLPGAIRSVPHWWGLLVVASDRSSVAELRAAKDNPKQDPTAIARLLWRNEIETALLARTGTCARGPEATLRRDLVRSMPVDELRAVVRGYLRDRTSWRAVG
jgi:hypothetical protein